MKSFVAYPLELETLSYAPLLEKKYAGKLIAHYELFKKVSHLAGTIVKCGITADEGFSRFIILKKMALTKVEQKMIAFEKIQPSFQEMMGDEIGATIKTTDIQSSSINEARELLLEKGLHENIQFVPGIVAEAIPNYLIENPECKIALLNIDLDDYEATLTTLEFLYPRLMPGGILILDNFHKYLAEHKAVKTYFAPSPVTINNFSVNNGPHYIIKP